MIQQVAAGSINVSTNSGLVDPIRAIQKGAPLAIVRIEVQVPPYSLLAKPGIKSMKDLKGKLISLGGAKDITRIFVEQMLEPNGVKPGEFDMTFAGATSARFSALQAGAVDAAILTPPFNFHAQTAGFTLLGHTVEYVDMPFAGISVNTNWAAANKDTAEKLITVYNDSMAWLYDPKNRDEAVEILMKVSKIKKDDVEKAYDFLIGGKYFEPTGKVSRSRLNKLVDALKTLGRYPAGFLGRDPVPAGRHADRQLTCSTRLRQNHLAGTLSVLGGLLFWELVSRLLVANALFLAAPSQIVYAIYQLTLTGELGRHIYISSIEFVDRLRDRGRDRHRARLRHGQQRALQAGDAAVDFRASTRRRRSRSRRCSFSGSASASGRRCWW